MTVRIEDANFSRVYLNRVLEDVRKIRPGIKTSKADFVVTRSTNAHGQRWMTFRFEDIEYNGYYWNAYEGRATGWEKWLDRREREQDEIEELQSVLNDMLRRLERSDWPRDGICSHHGVSAKVVGSGFTDYNLGISPSGDRLLITMYGSSTIGFPKRLHDKRVAAVAEALNAKAITTWNGGDDHNGVSVVVDRKCPDSLLFPIANYHKLGHRIFNLTDEYKARFDAFTDWYNNG